MNLVIVLLSVLKERKCIKRISSLRRPKDYFYANEDDESDERVQSEKDDELGFVAIKEEVREEKALVLQVEN